MNRDLLTTLKRYRYFHVASALEPQKTRREADPVVEFLFTRTGDYGAGKTTRESLSASIMDTYGDCVKNICFTGKDLMITIDTRGGYSFTAEQTWTSYEFEKAI
jgi:hypothetical protein